MASQHTPTLEHTGAAGGRRRTARAGLLGLGIVIILVALFAIGLMPRLEKRKRIAEAAELATETRPRVNVAQVRQSPATDEVMLPGSLQAIDETSILARADGYLRRRLVDIGDRVTPGQLLAEIETPELEQQIRQARAAAQQNRAALGQAQAKLAQTKADLQLAGVTAKRYDVLVQKGVLARQSGDEKQSAYEARLADVNAAEASIKAADANVLAADANVQRLLELQAFQRVTAPFAGVITARNVDVGTLIAAGGSASNRPMFTLARIDRLRVFVDVPQTYVPSVKAGLSADLLLQEFPKRAFPAKVVRTANSLDQKSHTLLTELQVPNPAGTLLPGMYAQVRFALHRAASPLIVRSEALLLRPDGPQVLVVNGSGIVRYQKVILGRDYGTEVEISSGLQGDERVILNPRDDLRDGAAVEARETK